MFIAFNFTYGIINDTWKYFNLEWIIIYFEM